MALLQLIHETRKTEDLHLLQEEVDAISYGGIVCPVSASAGGFSPVVGAADLLASMPSKEEQEQGRIFLDNDDDALLDGKGKEDVEINDANLRIGCRRRLFEDGFAEHIPKPFVHEIGNSLEEGLDAGFNIGTRFELLAHSIKCLRLLCSRTVLRNELRRMGLLRQFCSELCDVEKWLDLRVHAIGEVNDRLCWALREFIYLSQVLCQGGKIVNIFPAEEVFSKNLMTEHLGLRDRYCELGESLNSEEDNSVD